MSGFSRVDTSLLGRWWWTIDRWTLVAILLLMGFGAVLVMAASTPLSERLHGDAFHLAERQLVILPAAMATLLAFSLLSIKAVRRSAVMIFLGTLLATLLTLLVGEELNGATRWLSLGFLSVQPSEFLKPCFAVTIAWAFALGKERKDFPGASVAILLYLLCAGLLVAQPDLGQAVLISAIFGVQFFLAGLPLILVLAVALLFVGGMIAAYALLPHVSERINAFLDPKVAESYQIERAMEAYMNGGLFGTGPGEGTVKLVLPDAHSDFIYAVAGEEFGLLVCMMILLLFAFVVLRGQARLLSESSLFVLLAASGLLSQFGLQALINMASSLRLIPTKGMTLPFISYGGSSLLALALAMGLLLALTRRRTDLEGLS